MGETNGNFDGIVRRSLKEDEDLKCNRIVGDALINEMCYKCGRRRANGLAGRRKLTEL